MKKIVAQTIINLFVCVFFLPILKITAQSSNANSTNEVNRVRVDFVNPHGYTRQLLLGFTPDDRATDGFDYGYDALNWDDYPDDFGWVIENESYVIQGVGAFSDDKFYPVGAFLTNSGEISVKLNSTENFNRDIKVYLYDAETNLYTLLNSQDYTTQISSGNYLDRFYITFKEDVVTNRNTNDNLSNDSFNILDSSISYNKGLKSITVKTNNNFTINKLEILNISGQLVHRTQNTFNASEVSLKTDNFQSNLYIVRMHTSIGATAKKIIIF